MARILEYSPKKFNLGVPESAAEFQERKKSAPNDFRMSEAIRIQTGISKIEKESSEEDVERRTLEKLKEVQENAYQEAYKLGLEEGRKEAFHETSGIINEKLNHFENLLNTIDKMKIELMKQNEAHIVKLVFHMASRLAHKEVQVDNQAVLNIMNEAIQMAQIEENVRVQVSLEQFEFFETIKKEAHREFDFLKKIKFEPSEDVKPGGCMIETNYGMIDAQFEQRLSKLWETLSEHLYRVKEKIEAA